MYLLGKRADALNDEDIKRLVFNKVQENKSLDYKRDLKLTQDKDKKEFLFDVTAMSNTEGGCLIYGIQEGKDDKNQNTGTPETIIGIEFDNSDKLFQKIEDIIKGNTEPSISNIALNLLKVDGKNILVIGISKTLGLPIMVTFNETNKFFRRRNSGKYSVDVFELNQMFMQNQLLKENAEKFRVERIEKVRTNKVFPNLDIESSFFIHIIPFSFQSEQSLDLSNAAQIGLSRIMQPMYVSGWDSMFNLDGFATWRAGANYNIVSYDQLFRNGIYEIYTAKMFTKESLPNGETQLRMYGQQFIPDVISKINDGLEALKELHVEPPFIISISMIGIKSGIIFSQYQRGKPFMVDEIFLPPTILPTFETDIYKQLVSNFDIVWQSTGINRSPKYIPER